MGVGMRATGEDARAGAVLAAALGAAAMALLAPGAAEAGAWPKKRGEGQAIIQLAVDKADRAYDVDGDAVTPVSFDKTELSIFLEHGLTDRLTLVARPAIQSVQLDQGAATDKAEGLAATELGLRWAFLANGGWVGAVQGGLVMPGAAENALDRGLGEGTTGGEARLLLGKGWGDGARGGWLEGQAAYRAYEGDARDELRLDATLGLRPWRGWAGMAQAYAIASDGTEAPAERSFASLKGQLSVVKDLSSSLSLQAGAVRTLAGRNVVEEEAAFVALWWRY